MRSREATGSTGLIYLDTVLWASARGPGHAVDCWRRRPAAQSQGGPGGCLPAADGLRAPTSAQAGRAGDQSMAQRGVRVPFGGL